MEDEEYELLSHEKLERLKKELDHYKSNPFIKNSSDEKFFLSIKELTKSINSLIELFSDVKSELIKEYNEGSPDEKLERLLNQNKYIAEAIVSMSEKLDKNPKELQPQITRPGFSQNYDLQNNQSTNQSQVQPQNNQFPKSNVASDTYDPSYAFGPGASPKKEFDLPDFDDSDINSLGSMNIPLQNNVPSQNQQGFQQNQNNQLNQQGFQQQFNNQPNQQNQLNQQNQFNQQGQLNQQNQFNQQGQPFQNNFSPDAFQGNQMNTQNIPSPENKDKEHEKKKKFLGFM